LRILKLALIACGVFYLIQPLLLDLSLNGSPWAVVPATAMVSDTTVVPRIPDPTVVPKQSSRQIIVSASSLPWTRAVQSGATQYAAMLDDVELPLRIAVYPPQYLNLHNNEGGGRAARAAEELAAEELAAVLFAELSTVSDIEIYDRTDLNRVFDEKIIQGSFLSSTRSDRIAGVTPAEFVLIGQLTQASDGADFRFQLVHARTAYVLFADSVPWRVGDSVATVQSAVLALQDRLTEIRTNLFSKAYPEKPEVQLDNKKGHLDLDWGTLAVGRFLSAGDGQLATIDAGKFRQNLLRTLQRDTNARLVARSNLVPVVLERDLRRFQDPLATADEIRPGTDSLVYGYYDIWPGRADSIELYLYIDRLTAGRELFVLSGRNWSDIHLQTISLLEAELAKSHVTMAERGVADRLFAEATSQLQMDARVAGSTHRQWQLRFKPRTRAVLAKEGLAGQQDFSFNRGNQLYRGNWYVQAKPVQCLSQGQCLLIPLLKKLGCRPLIFA